ncbi:MAG: hypothetical protein ACOYD7_02020 [Raoultibacter sp.]|jgi:hypothetical protein
MRRFTSKREDGSHLVVSEEIHAEKEGFAGPAIEALAAYESMYEVLVQQHKNAEEKLEQFKAQGKLKTSTAQQLLAQKLTYSSMLNLIDLCMNDGQNGDDRP